MIFLAERITYTREELLKQIKSCGQSIIDNAEDILGNERYFLKLSIGFDIFRNRNTEPCIEINRMFVPETIIEDELTYKEIKFRKELK